MGFFSSIAKTLFGSKQESKQSKRESNQSPDSPPKDSEFPYTQEDAAKFTSDLIYGIENSYLRERWSQTREPPRFLFT